MSDQEKRQKVIDLQMSLIKSGHFPTCLHCEHFNEKEEVCTKWKARPPVRIIVTGCTQYSQDVPF